MEIEYRTTEKIFPSIRKGLNEIFTTERHKYFYRETQNRCIQFFKSNKKSQQKILVRSSVMIKILVFELNNLPKRHEIKALNEIKNVICQHDDLDKNQVLRLIEDKIEEVRFR